MTCYRTFNKMFSILNTMYSLGNYSRTKEKDIDRFSSKVCRPFAARSNSPTDVCLRALLKGGKTGPHDHKARRFLRYCKDVAISSQFFPRYLTTLFQQQTSFNIFDKLQHFRELPHCHWVR